MKSTDIETISLCKLCMQPLSLNAEVSPGYFTACSNCDEDLFEIETIVEIKKQECKSDS